jgi:hypothetical protein
MVDETLSKEEVSALKAFFAVVRLSATFYVVCTTEKNFWPAPAKKGGSREQRPSFWRALWCGRREGS